MCTAVASCKRTAVIVPLLFVSTGREVDPTAREVIVCTAVIVFEASVLVAAVLQPAVAC